MENVSPTEYVCPACGAPARGASTCSGCGTDLDAFRELPTHGEYRTGDERAVSVTYEPQAVKAAGQPGPILDRFLAGLIDGLIVVGIPIGLGLLSYVAIGDTAYTVGGIAYLALLLLYAPVMLAFHGGQTWGRQAMDVRVRNHSGEDTGLGRALLRELIVKLALTVTGIGWIVDVIVALARSDRRALHDLIVGTEVVTAA